jgi:hypothetical protein
MKIVLDLLLFHQMQVLKDSLLHKHLMHLQLFDACLMLLENVIPVPEVDGVAPVPKPMFPASAIIVITLLIVIAVPCAIVIYTM